ncbi:MAG: hypothetical protein MK183_03365 [Verrucomicrobiales bacterium]|nr:hypothetical protein [Verrucomicrobiales bacterium]
MNRFIIPASLCISLALTVLCPAAIPEVQDALKSGSLSAYHGQVTEFINRRVAVHLSGNTKKSLQHLLDEPALRRALAQRQLIGKLGAARIDEFAKGGKTQKAFLGSLLLNTPAMEHALEGATPIGHSHRQQDKWTIPISALGIWHHLLNSDPDAQSGIYLKLALATGLNPPGTGNQGAGQAKSPETPLARYRFYKNSHQNGELFPSFDNLSVWEYRQIVSSNASNADLEWGRNAINTWRPDLRNNELVVNSTSEVWRRNSPIPFNDTFKNVLAGGGKCGPRSSWSIFICQAFGIPATGVRQPGHVCATYKSAYPDVQPQPGNIWKVVYGRGWHVSKACGISGEEFMQEMSARAHLAGFMRGERLRWLSAAMQSKSTSEKIMALAAVMPPLQAPDQPVTARQRKASSATGSITPPDPGTIRFDAVSFSTANGIQVHDCFTGGKQVYNGKYAPGWGTPADITWKVNVQSAGTYGLTLQAAVANVEQTVLISINGGNPVPVSIANSHGLWQKTRSLDIAMKPGENTINLTRPETGRGLALRYLEVRKKS